MLYNRQEQEEEECQLYQIMMLCPIKRKAGIRTTARSDFNRKKSKFSVRYMKGWAETPSLEIGV